MIKRTILICGLLLTVIYLNQHRIKMVIPNPTQFKTINDYLKEQGISNPVIRLAILGLIGTEGGYTCKEEMSYAKTSAQRLRFIFGKRLDHYTGEQLDTLKKDNVAFYDVIYGYRYGNDQPGDGWKYRGRGLNGITFKGAYERYGKMLGLDLVANPELLNKPEIAARALAAYFMDNYETGKRSGALKRKFNLTDWNDIKDQDTAIRLICQINAGWGTNITGGIFPDKLAKMNDFTNTIANTYTKIV